MLAHGTKLLPSNDKTNMNEKSPFEFIPTLNTRASNIYANIFRLLRIRLHHSYCCTVKCHSVVFVVVVHFNILLWLNVFTFTWYTYLDSADGLQPGAFLHNRNNIPTYSNEIRNSGKTYDDKKNETCWMWEEKKI